MMKRSATTNLFFVYGTLMKGFEEEWRRRVGARFVGRGRINGKLYDLGEYPGAIRSAADSGEYVKGELYEVRNTEVATRILDQFEEFFPQRPDKSLFVRIMVPVTLEDGGSVNAWVYVYNRPLDETKLVPSGDYRDLLAGRRR